MDKPLPALEKVKREIFEEIRQEDIDEVNASSKKVTVNLYRGVKSGRDPWMFCFSFNDDESDEFAKNSSTSLVSIKNPIRDRLLEMISNQSSVTDEELNRCKSALRTETHANYLPDLSSTPHVLRLLFLKFRGVFIHYRTKQEKLYGDIGCYFQRFEMCIKNGLEALKPFSSIPVTASTTADSAKANITNMRKAMLDLKTFAFLAEENLRYIFENQDKCEELDGDIDREVFQILAHFLAKFLVTRCMRKRENTNL